MGNEELVGYLIRSAEDRAETILARAREQADGLLARARAQAEAMERESLESLARDADREREIRMSRARREARATEQRARGSLAAEIVGRLRERLSSLPAEDRYPGIVVGLYREIQPEIPEGSVLLLADAKGREILEPLVSDPRIRFAPLPEEELGGLSTSDEACTVLVRNTLRARLENALPALTAEIRRNLVGPDE